MLSSEGMTFPHQLQQRKSESHMSSVLGQNVIFARCSSNFKFPSAVCAVYVMEHSIISAWDDNSSTLGHAKYLCVNKSKK